MGVVKRFYQREIQPIVHATDPRLAMVMVLSSACLINKRYLADEGMGGPADTRWLSMTAWMISLLIFVLVLRATSKKWLIALAGLFGIGLMFTLNGFTQLGMPGVPHYQPAWANQAVGNDSVMLLLVWIPVTLVLAAFSSHGEPPVWPKRATVIPIVIVVVAFFVVMGIGPVGKLRNDNRWDQMNWCWLTFCWLFLLTQLPTRTLWRGEAENDGLGLGRWKFWVPWTVVLLCFMIPLIVWFAGKRPDFVQYYPMYKPDWPGYDPRKDGYTFLIIFELSYGLYFFAWEYFFRGWMLFRLGKVMGVAAILVQTAPFVLMHIGKPGPELHSSLIAGLVLGWLAWRSRSMWPCFLLHWGAACTMDLVGAYHGLQGAPLP